MSTILSKEDLNDFITPGVACIKPVEVPKTQDQAGEIEIGSSGEAYEVTLDGQQKQKLDSAQINLSDCLACSGCITSAESVLVSLQSHTELLNSLKEKKNDSIFVASISHQARVSLAAAYELTIEQADKRLWHLLKDLGFHHVVGLEVGRAIALEYGAQEVLSSSSNSESENENIKKPILSSSCPGWTCYVEKTHPHIIPHLSKVKSPQQITGSLVKRLLSQQHGVEYDKIYHLSIMPCFDKKLEASRPEFGTETYRDVDCVITTKEIIQLLVDKASVEFSSLPEADSPLPAPIHWPQQEQWLSHRGTSSGGYLDYVVSALCDSTDENTRVEVIPGRNSDVVEYSVVSEVDGRQIGRVAQFYGFKNIQNLVRKLKKSSKSSGRGSVNIKRRPAAGATGNGSSSSVDQWDYVEVMACPGGCINGGGQIGRPAQLTSKQWKDQMEELYGSMVQHNVNRQLVEQYTKLLWGGSDSELVGAEFHAVQADPSIPKVLSVGTTW